MGETIKLNIGIPTSGLLSGECAFSLAGLVGALSTTGIPSRQCTGLQLRIDVVKGSTIHANRQAIVKHTLEGGFTHLLFIDDDMWFDPAAVNMLFSRRQPAVMTNYLIKDCERDDGKRFTAIDMEGNRVQTTEKSSGLQPIAYSGFGLSLFDAAAIAKMKAPHFPVVWNDETETYTTEDGPFCLTLREVNGCEVYLDHDASKLVSHWGRHEWRWDLPLPVGAKSQPINVGPDAPQLRRVS